MYEEPEYYLANILVQEENQTTQLNQVINDLSVIKSYQENQIVQLTSIIDAQERTIQVCSVYIGCVNLILMIILLCKFLPARKGVLRNVKTETY